MKGLDGKVALVTGGGKGIGQAIALALGARGVRLILTGRDEKALGRTIGEVVHGGGKARHLAGDARDAAHIDAAIARAASIFGKLDIVIANAAEASAVDIMGDRNLAQGVYATNVGATWAAFSGASRVIETGGRMLATAALHGRGKGAALASATGAITELVRSVAGDLAVRSVTVNALVPSSIDLRRETSAEEIAELVAFLCSSGGSAITGQAIALA